MATKDATATRPRPRNGRAKAESEKGPNEKIVGAMAAHVLAEMISDRLEKRLRAEETPASAFQQLTPMGDSSSRMLEKASAAIGQPKVTPTNVLLDHAVELATKLHGRVLSFEERTTCSTADRAAEDPLPAGMNGPISRVIELLDSMHGSISRLSAYTGIEV